MFAARADQITATGNYGLTVTSADGRTYAVESVVVRLPEGVSIAGIEELTATGISGFRNAGGPNRRLTSADGITGTGVGMLRIGNALSLTATDANGKTFAVAARGSGIHGISTLAMAAAAGVDIRGAHNISAADGVELLAAGGGGRWARADGVTATGIDGVSATGIDGVTATGIDGVTATGIDGQTHRVSSIFIGTADGVTATGIDGVSATGIDGLTLIGPNSLLMNEVSGISATGIDQLFIAAADGVTATGIDGRIFTIPSGALSLAGIDHLHGSDGRDVRLEGFDTLSVTGLLRIAQTGLQGVDNLLAGLLNQATDDSGVNAAIVYHRPPTEDDLQDLSQIGILGGTRFRSLPAVVVFATSRQLKKIAELPNVRALYTNRTLAPLAVAGAGLVGAERARADADLLAISGNTGLTGRGTTVAVLDTGIDATHTDLAGRVVNNVRLSGTFGLTLGFRYPVYSENQANTDLTTGHGTFVAGVIAGSGAQSNGKYAGIAPGARLLGLSAGGSNLFYVLEGFDYLLTHGAAQGVRVVNCSFSAAGGFDPHDPVNIATRMLAERGVSVVFSAGNTGPALGTLNPYAMAPWVISVGATDDLARLAAFSARARFASAVGPTLVAPGVGVVSLRASSLANLTGLLGLATGSDLQQLSASERVRYTTGTGTSFSAPVVSGAIALLLEANPALGPAEIRDLLQRTATPLPPYHSYEVGAGLLNIHAALLEAAFPKRRMGLYRATLERKQAEFVAEPARSISGAVIPLQTHRTKLTVPQGALYLAAEISWGSLLNINDLNLSLVDPRGRRITGDTLNLPLLTGYRERVSVEDPEPGAWEIQIKHSLGLLGAPQAVTGAYAIARVDYAPVEDISALSSTMQQAILQSLRTHVLSAYGRNFRPQFPVSRADIATALVRGAGAPQYLAAAPLYTDVRDLSTRTMVESAHAAPAGPLFYDTNPGANFRPDEAVNRLTAAVALVRAAGLRRNAETFSGSLLLSDTAQIPAQWRGYVAVALSRGLLEKDGLAFSPQRALTRAELARALAVIADGRR
ncbi:MAG: S8 family serine peptidase [Blastocatellales bacterium]|nr:S8 family serine peptidase [Blastocatellales bacterium]